MREIGIDPDQRGASSTLAKRADIAESQINRWLKQGHQPSIENLRKIAPVLRVDMLDLLVSAGHISANEATSPHPPGRTSAEDAIYADRALAERDKRILLATLAEMRERVSEAPHPPDETSSRPSE
jgi:transcriptional regulator with XRE-family HTH domain